MVKLSRDGFTLIELMIGAAVLAIAIVALIGAFLGQITLNEHARNLTLAITDANRVMERLRQYNTGCPSPSADASTITGGAFATWDAWLADTTASGGGGKSIQQSPSPNAEYVDVRCLPGGGDDCTAGTDPIQVTVSICWTHRLREIPGPPECDYDPGTLVWTATPGANNVVDSPAMLTTLMTCRQ